MRDLRINDGLDPVPLEITAGPFLVYMISMTAKARYKVTPMIVLSNVIKIDDKSECNIRMVNGKQPKIF
jgi:hypothetical protein